ncbi:uncharacterized protein BDW70DRAFT_98902 [Aspergillus foveolatus]|uniref:uncharacterized protein n=1 Tax=Aspergillus foveolatus TaxID=210207 RepID=UPI003CCD090A
MIHISLICEDRRANRFELFVCMYIFHCTLIWGKVRCFLDSSHASCILYNLACIRVPHFAVSQAHLVFWDAAELFNLSVYLKIAIGRILFTPGFTPGAALFWISI